MEEEEIQTLKQSDDWLLQWVRVPQGLASAAPFWNVHIADGFNTLMGEGWREYWAQYVDDCLVFATTEEQCRHSHTDRGCLRLLSGFGERKCRIRLTG